MDRNTELALIDELLGLDAARSAYLDETVTRAPVAHYIDDPHFADETRAIFRRHPAMAAHHSELPDPGSFLRKQIAGLPCLLTRDRFGTVHAFLNVCRHRGARLVDEDSGCKHLFACPYHAWTWTNQGELRGIPQEKQGFPGLNRAEYGLRRLPCVERFGWIWVTPDPDDDCDIDSFLAPIAPDLDWLSMTDMRIAHSDDFTCAANWKLLIEGGIEAYHFRVAHAETIGPYFPDNLSTYQTFGAHMRSVLPRITFGELRDQPREQWEIRAHANMVYTLFPTSQFLVQSDHIVWIQLTPINAGETQIRLSTLAPTGPDAQPDDHWARNHAITRRTLREDFDIGASIQSGLTSGANSDLTFGRFEGALNRFATTLQQAFQTET